MRRNTGEIILLMVQYFFNLVDVYFNRGVFSGQYRYVLYLKIRKDDFWRYRINLHFIREEAVKPYCPKKISPELLLK
jgi:hypothetical protein